jgi:hypothetical protein
MSQDRRKEKISYSYYPAKIPTFQEWCIRLGVSSAYIKTNLYQGNQLDLKKLKIKLND